MTCEPSPDAILIGGLELQCEIGVPDEERLSAQRILVDVRLVPPIAFESLDDDILGTVDYDAVCRRLMEIASSRPRRLIETLAADLANAIVREFAALEATVEVRKFILKNTEFVGVRCTRMRHP